VEASYGGGTRTRFLRDVTSDGGVHRHRTPYHITSGARNDDEGASADAGIGHSSPDSISDNRVGDDRSGRDPCAPQLGRE